MKLFKLKVVDEMPQWIISSDKGAYHPGSTTIYVVKQQGLKTVLTLFHEIGHWLGCEMGWMWIHVWLDGKHRCL